MLDNMDGKHARNSGTSSPLGMMFDHGCDALVTFFFTQGLATIVGLSMINNISYIIIVIYNNSYIYNLLTYSNIF